MKNSEIIKAAFLIKAAGGFNLALKAAPRSYAEKGLLKAFEQTSKKFPKAEPRLLDKLTRQIESIERRPVDLAENSHAVGSYLHDLRMQLANAARREEIMPTPDTSWLTNATRKRKLTPIMKALQHEQNRLGKLSPGQLNREKFRMDKLLNLKKPGNDPLIGGEGRFLEKLNNRYW